MKYPVFLSSPIYPPFISTNTSLSTNRDDHLISLLSHDDFIFKAQLTSLYMHPTDYSFRLYDKNQDFFHSAYMTKIKTSSHLLLQKSCVHTNTGLTRESESFLCKLTFFAHLYMF